MNNNDYYCYNNFDNRANINTNDANDTNDNK